MNGAPCASYSPEDPCLTSPFGEYFTRLIGRRRCTFFYGGWGKIAAAASTQYVIDRWQPDLLVNLGTCGGFAGQIERGEIILVDKTVVYDIYEQMGDFDAHIAHFTTQIDLDWLPQPYPTPVRRALLVSGDRDLLVEDIPMLEGALRRHRRGLGVGRDRLGGRPQRRPHADPARRHRPGRQPGQRRLWEPGIFRERRL